MSPKGAEAEAGGIRESISAQQPCNGLSGEVIIIVFGGKAIADGLTCCVCTSAVKFFSLLTLGDTHVHICPPPLKITEAHQTQSIGFSPFLFKLQVDSVAWLQSPEIYILQPALSPALQADFIAVLSV